MAENYKVGLAKSNLHEISILRTSGLQECRAETKHVANIWCDGNNIHFHSNIVEEASLNDYRSEVLLYTLQLFLVVWF